jgi:uncharacterized protein
MTERFTELISSLELAPHPEGGHYREVYRSGQTVSSPVNGEPRSAVTDIYFLLTAGEVSRFHRVLHDEIWNFYEGTPLELIQFDPKTGSLETIILGPGDDRPRYKHCIAGGAWQAARSTGTYTLMGCTVAPGFDFADFSFLDDEAEVSAAILELDPEMKVFI